MKHNGLYIIFVLSVFLTACAPVKERGWFFLNWAELPSDHVVSLADIPEADIVKFEFLAGFAEGEKNFDSIKGQLQEGDVLAYRMGALESAKDIALGKLNRIGYQILDYGHLAIVVKSDDSKDKLTLFSSESFKGPNTDEGIDTLLDHSFDVYRLNKHDLMDKERLNEFVRLAKQKAGKWYGYDFSGMFGLWNSNLKPDKPENIGHDYICSTIVMSALYYAGVELMVSGRSGVLDLVTPKQVISSSGRIIGTSSTGFEIEIRNYATSDESGLLSPEK